MNFLLGVAFRRVSPALLPYLMEWTTGEEDKAHDARPNEWATAVRIRGEGLARLAAAPPALIIIMYMSAYISLWWVILIVPLAAIVLHGYAALQQFKSHAEYLEEILKQPEPKAS